MGLENLKRVQDRQGGMAAKIAVSPPVAVRVASGAFVTLLDIPGLARGTTVAVVQAPEVGGARIESVLAGAPGERPVYATGPDDVVVFESGYWDGKALVVGKVATRIHDGMAGRVQVLRGLARPSRASVSKRGAIQFATLADPASSAIVTSHDELAELAERVFAREYPGGTPGFLMRDKGGCEEFFAQETDDGYETPAEMVARLVEDVKVLSAGQLRAIPAWSLPMGREQVTRDVNPRQPTTSPVAGPFTRLYGADRGRGYLPSLAIVSDEEQWAFGAKTGRTQRVVSGLHPMRLDGPVNAGTMPAPGQPGVVTRLQELYDGEAMDRAATRRGFARARLASASVPPPEPPPKAAPAIPGMSRAPRPRGM